MKQETQKPVIIFISNRFGYGPTITLLHIIREFINRIDAEFIFAGSDICKEAFDFSLETKVKFIELDERNYDKIKEFLSEFKNRKVFLISCLNRLAILAANELHVPNALIDFLTWMWNEIPQGYEKADYYFSNHFGTKNKKPYMIEVPLILGNIPDKKNVEKKYLLINIGGAQNHLVPGVQENYFKLLSSLLNKINVPVGLTVVIAGGSHAINFLKELNARPEFRIESLSSKEYIAIQNKSKKIISLAGTNSTFMSFILGIPVVFLLPQLYAHWELALLLKEKKYITRCQHWDDYILVPANINLLTEKDSISLIEDLSTKAFYDDNIFNKISTDLQSMIDEEIDINGQGKFIKDIGVGGEKKICNYLINRWFI